MEDNSLTKLYFWRNVKMMNGLIYGKTIGVMVFINKETDFKTADSVLSYAVRGKIERGYTENSECYYGFKLYPSQVESFILYCKTTKIHVKILD